MRPDKIHRWADTWADVRRGFADFLAVPALTILGFLLLAVGTYALDRNAAGWLAPVHELLESRLLTEEDTTNALLGTIAGGMITVTSITFSLLLLAVQQSAASLTTQVLDQFLRRRLNQFYFGVFVGVALYALATLATTNTRVTPVFGTAVALLLTFVALTVLVFLLYTTLNQMRPNRIIGAIHDLTLQAREQQRSLLEHTRRRPQLDAAPVVVAVASDTNGYVANIHLDRIGDAVEQASGEVEVVLRVAMGDYVCYRDVVAEVRAQTMEDARALGAAVRRALECERQRSSHRDPAFGVTQLATIGWTSISTSKSNPAPGLATLHNLRDLLARWSEEAAAERQEAEAPDGADASTDAPLPIVYRDEVLEGVIDALESLAVVSSESMQHQSCAEVVDALAALYDRLPRALQPRAEDAVRRILSALGDHVLTARLDGALTRLGSVLLAAGRIDTGLAVQQARGALATSVGTLHSRADRVPSER